MNIIRRLNIEDVNFIQQLNQLLRWEPVSDANIVTRVEEIIGDVRHNGDTALLALTQRFDRFQATSAAKLEISNEQCRDALEALNPPLRDALEIAAARIRHYAENQKLQSWSYEESNGTVLGQKITPLARVGIYVPGGKAAYSSTVLMNAIPAKVAEVPEIIMVSPTPDGQINNTVLAAAAVAGVDRFFTIGGAQAIAALAYGTETIPPVDKIVGPGNAYVATAKRQVFGKVGIDMIAGPSEILIFADANIPADWIATDMFAQAEHDEDAQAILISTDGNYLDAVENSIQKLLKGRPRREMIEASLKKRGALIQVNTDDEAVNLINRIAPEHLELAVENASEVSTKIKHAGAIFIGNYSAEVFGDYCAGPNHVLPTSGTARFSSPLGVYDFQKRSSIIQCSPAGANELAKTAATLARAEGLIAHAESAEVRSSSNN